MSRGKQGMRRAKAKPPSPAPANASPSKQTFPAAVASSPPKVAAALQPGKQALTKKHRAQVTCADEQRWTGSLDLDAALAQEPPHTSANRWDYGLGYQDPAGRESAVWVEVHSAETSEVSTVIRKLRWLQAYLPAHCPDLWKLTLASPASMRFVWVASGRHSILATSPQRRALQAAGLDPPRSKFDLP